MSVGMNASEHRIQACVIWLQVAWWQQPYWQHRSRYSLRLSPLVLWGACVVLCSFVPVCSSRAICRWLFGNNLTGVLPSSVTPQREKLVGQGIQILQRGKKGNLERHSATQLAGTQIPKSTVCSKLNVEALLILRNPFWVSYWQPFLDAELVLEDRTV